MLSDTQLITGRTMQDAEVGHRFDCTWRLVASTFVSFLECDHVWLHPLADHSTRMHMHRNYVAQAVWQQVISKCVASQSTFDAVLRFACSQISI
jgi:hypothetical protein